MEDETRILVSFCYTTKISDVITIMKKKNTLNFFTPGHGRLEAILINAGISAGFPSCRRF